MTRRYWAMPVLLLLAGLAWAAPAVDLITLQAPWRAYLVNGLNVSRE
jgi:hypothetical protein